MVGWTETVGINEVIGRDVDAVDIELDATEVDAVEVVTVDVVFVVELGNTCRESVAEAMLTFVPPPVRVMLYVRGTMPWPVNMCITPENGGLPYCL